MRRKMQMSLLLHQALYPQLEAEPKLNHFQNIEMPRACVSRMERKGVLIDANVLAAQSKVITARLAELEKEAFELAGGV